MVYHLSGKMANQSHVDHNSDRREIFMCPWSEHYEGSDLLGQNRQASELCFVIKYNSGCVGDKKLTDKKVFITKGKGNVRERRGIQKLHCYSTG